ncbi:hypothetical protein [Microbacterium aurantiacum]|uniref:hypothetical protein n=1 Tax=Microbacterium aurantiacum TaxID=162393 RepID=UPI000C80DD99|nr:hypothetical protein [Microbacterium aurantiacum]
MEGQKDNTDDWIIICLVVSFALVTGVISAGAILAPVRDWMLQFHLLEQGSAVIIPFADGIGLGGVQILVLAAFLLIAIAIGVWAKRRETARV